MRKVSPVIRLEDLTKGFWLRGQYTPVIDRLTLTLPNDRSLALLGPNGAGKSTLLAMIAGILPPDRGRVLRDGQISWPVGLGGTFHPQMTGAQNTRFVARLYGVDSDSLLAFVADFSELGEAFHHPIKTYSSGMRSRLGFGMVMGIPFDTYLIDEVTAVGDARFIRKSRAVFQARMKHASAIVVSHQMATLREFCDAGLVLHRGGLEIFEDIEDAIARHLEMNI